MQSLKVFAINGQEITHSEEIQLAICTGGLIVPMGKMTVEKKSLKSVLVKSCSVDRYWSVEACVGNEVDRRLASENVLQTLSGLFTHSSGVRYLRIGGGPDFTAFKVRHWLACFEVRTLFIKPSIARENGYVESSAGKFRDE